MSLIEIQGEDTWLKDLEHTATVIKQINDAASQQQEIQANSIQNLASISVKLNILLPQAENQVENLIAELKRIQTVRPESFGPNEYQKRLQLCVLMQNSLHKANTTLKKSSADIDQSVHTDFSSWGEDDTDQTSLIPYNATHAQRQLTIAAQEESLEALSSVISNQKKIAKTIQSEVHSQNDIIDDIQNQTQNVTNDVEVTRNQVNTVHKKSSTWYLWVIIVAEFAAIIAVTVW